MSKRKRKPIDKAKRQQSKADVPWQRFEKVTARIEASLAPIGAVVVLNDKIRDNETGRLREVDAAIRFRAGTINILINLECRRRGARQDVTWIEQLVTKKRKIGAATTIAISLSGFSEPARKTASQNGIELRTLYELEVGELSWLQFLHLDLHLNSTAVQQADIELWDPPPPDTEIVYDQQLLAKCGGREDRYPLFIQASTQNRYGFDEVIRLIEQQGHKFFASFGSDVSAEHRVRWHCHDPGIVIDTSYGRLPVRYISLVVIAKQDRRKIPVLNVFRYAAAEGPLVEGVEFDLSMGLSNTVLGMYKDADGKYQISICRHSPNCKQS